jgi:guanylate kinase
MSKGSFRERLKSAEKELNKQDDFDYKIVNYEGKLNETIAAIVKILKPHLRTIPASGVKKKTRPRPRTARG